MLLYIRDIITVLFFLWLVMITDQLSSSFECTNFIFAFICFRNRAQVAS